MSATALRKIEQELNALAAQADTENPIDPYEVRVLSRKVGAQAESMEQGLSE